MKQILLVEDDEIMRITVYDRLVQEKWQVDAVTNGREARGKLEQKHYHLILSDIRMPGMGGMELLELAKRHSPMTWPYSGRPIVYSPGSSSAARKGAM